MAIKIYTKTGDKGDTGLIGGTRVHKHHVRIESYGTVDELNAHVGLVRDSIAIDAVKELLQTIQDRLFVIGSTLAVDPDKEPGFPLPQLAVTDIEMLEQAIDQMNLSLPEMRHFLLPGGHIVVSQIHIARCVCRRAERRCVELDHAGGGVSAMVVMFLNRLSDYLFVLSRYMAAHLHADEIPWRAAK